MIGQIVTQLYAVIVSVNEQGQIKASLPSPMISTKAGWWTIEGMSSQVSHPGVYIIDPTGRVDSDKDCLSLVDDPAMGILYVLPDLLTASILRLSLNHVHHIKTELHRRLITKVGRN